MIGYIIFVLCICVIYFNHGLSSKYILYILVLFSALRYDTGWDYMTYINWIGRTCHDTAEYVRDVGPFWKWIFSLAKYSTPWMPISLVALITNILIYSSLRLIIRNRDNVIKSALVFYAFFPSCYYDSFAIIRQWFAVALCLFAFCLYVRKQETIYAFIFIIISVLSSFYLHSSSIVSILLLPIWRYFKQYKNIWLISILTVIIVFTVIFSFRYSPAFASMVSGEYAIYSNMQDNYGGKIIYVYIMMVFGALISYKHIRRERDVNFWFFSAIMGMIANIGINLFLDLAMLSRIMLYFNVMWMFIIAFVVDKNKKYKFIYFIFMAGLFFIQLIIVKEVTTMPSPYIPYKTIFSLYL